MAYYRYSIEYHLTPRGWITGTRTHFDKTERAVQPPEDRVETWLIEVEQEPRLFRRRSGMEVHLDRFAKGVREKAAVRKISASIPIPQTTQQVWHVRPYA